jgi:hypothetical protein
MSVLNIKIQRKDINSNTDNISESAKGKDYTNKKIKIGGKTRKMRVYNDTISDTSESVKFDLKIFKPLLSDIKKVANDSIKSGTKVLDILNIEIKTRAQLISVYNKLNKLNLFDINDSLNLRIRVLEEKMGREGLLD